MPTVAEDGVAAHPAPRTNIVEVRDLVKRYPKRSENAVDGVSFDVRRGEVFGLLGPNGAGKTTTIGILTTRVRLTSGHASINGLEVARDPVAVKQQFAVVPQRNNLDRSLTARQNLIFHAAYFGFSRQERETRADAVLEQFGLGDRGSDKVDKYSGGMAQRLMIARALMHAPALLFLDEPTTGLDPQARLFVWDRVKELNAQGITVFITTHDMDEAEALCSRVAIMDHGKILVLDTPEALKALVPGESALELRVQPEQDDDEAVERLVRALGTLRGVERAERVTRGVAMPTMTAPANPWMPGGANPSAPSDDSDDAALIRLYGDDAAGLIAPSVQTVTDCGGTLRGIDITKPSLEDVFIHLTGRGLR